MAARQAAWIVAAAAAAGLRGGCASGDAPADRAEHFHRALADGDGSGACDDLSQETRTALEQQEQKPCEEAITGLRLPEHAGEPETEVYGSMAQVRMGEETLFLSRYDDGWRVVAAGCRPTSGDRPHECELEGG